MMRMLLLAGLAAVMMVPNAFAQEAETPSAALVVTSVDGTQSHSYEIDDLSLSAMRSSGYDLMSEPRADYSVSISGIRPVDKALLEWAQLTSGVEGFRSATISIPASSPEADDAMTYELTQTRVTSLSASHSVAAGSRYFTLQLAARSLAINGTPMR